MNETRRSIALVIREPGDPGVPGCGPGPRWLVVRRPDDDEDLPGVWGLPAGTRQEGESALELVGRIGSEKLGVEVEPGAAVADGSTDRARYRLDMELWTATIVKGSPVVGHEAPEGRTAYAEWKWDDPGALSHGARAGSLCCRLGLEAAGYPAE